MPASGGAGEPQEGLALCGMLAAGPPSRRLSCLQVTGACGYARDLGAGSCDDRRIRQVIGRNVLSAPRYPALCSL